MYLVWDFCVFVLGFLYIWFGQKDSDFCYICYICNLPLRFPLWYQIWVVYLHREQKIANGNVYLAPSISLMKAVKLVFCSKWKWKSNESCFVCTEKIVVGAAWWKLCVNAIVLFSLWRKCQIIALLAQTYSYPRFITLFPHNQWVQRVSVQHNWSFLFKCMSGPNKVVSPLMEKSAYGQDRQPRIAFKMFKKQCFARMTEKVPMMIMTKWSLWWCF